MITNLLRKDPANREVDEVFLVGTFSKVENGRLPLGQFMSWMTVDLRGGMYYVEANRGWKMDQALAMPARCLPKDADEDALIPVLRLRAALELFPSTLVLEAVVSPAEEKLARQLMFRQVADGQVVLLALNPPAAEKPPAPAEKPAKKKVE